MATALHNLSDYDFNKVPDASNMCFGIVVAEWNPEITGARLNATQEIPVIYGLLTTNDLQQAKDRSGGKLGNKGDECAVDAIKMAKF